MPRVKKVNFSISPEADKYLTDLKNGTGVPKSKVLDMLIITYGKDLAKDLLKYSRKEDTATGDTVTNYAV